MNFVPVASWRRLLLIIVVPVVAIMVVALLAVALAIASIHDLLDEVFLGISVLVIVVIALWAWSFIDLAWKVLRDRRLDKLAASAPQPAAGRN